MRDDCDWIDRLVGSPDERQLEDREPTSWVPVDLTEALAGADVEPPKVLARTDGLCLLYPGRVHSVQGESESCKSWGVQLGAVQEIELEHDVLYIDFEDDARGVVSRLIAMGVSAEQIAAHFVYIRPDEPLRTRRDEATQAGSDLLDAFTGRQFSLCIIDGVTEAMTVEGLDLMSNADIATWMRRLPRRIARIGAAVVVLDHLVKDRATQGRYALGGQHKLSGLSGAAYKFTTTKWFSRATGVEEVQGRVVVTVEKDRPGYVRGRAVEDKVGVLLLTSYPDGGVRITLEPPDAATTVDRKIVARIVDYLDVYDGSSKNAIESGIEGRGTAIRDALQWMAENDLVRVEPKGRSHLHWLTDLGREGRDE